MFDNSGDVRGRPTKMELCYKEMIRAVYPIVQRRS